MSNKALTGGGDDKKGIPPTATAYQGLLGRSKVARIRAGMALPPPTSITVSSVFAPGQPNRMFEDSAHHVLIVPSGSGQGKPHPSSFGTLLGGAQQWHHPVGQNSSNLGIVGFDSLSRPYPAPYYASFSNTGDSDPHQLHATPDAAIVSQAYFSQKGRYLKSRSLRSIIPDTGNIEYDILDSISVTWIAGNGNNGGDTPDIFAFNANANNSTGLATDGPLGDFRGGENLYVQLFSKDNQPLGVPVFLWKTKPDPTAAQLAAAAADPNINVWSINPVTLYPSREFTTTVIPVSEFQATPGVDDFFVIRQTAHTAFLDNYGVKHVELKLSRTVRNS